MNIEDCKIEICKIYIEFGFGVLGKMPGSKLVVVGGFARDKFGLACQRYAWMGKWVAFGSGLAKQQRT
ncbi:MAG: hypothetical protein N2B02_06340, partial [Amylibacter sp.]